MIDNNEIFQENYDKPLIKSLLSFFMPKNDLFFSFLWTIEKFEFIKLFYLVFKLLLTTRTGKRILDRSTNYTLFKEYENFMNMMVKLLSDHRHKLHGSFITTNLKKINQRHEELQ